jgi:hypothetical protein
MATVPRRLLNPFSDSFMIGAAVVLARRSSLV